jgi:endonuclease/exonuclease/phosphatase family metal-dependent hydrolase
MDWNIRGVNSIERCDDLANKISQSNPSIICLQETKNESFDSTCIRKFCLRRMNQFAYQPSIGLSGGIITIWNGSLFSGTIISQTRFQITVKLQCNISQDIFYVTNVYAPCDTEGRTEFIEWFMTLDYSLYDLWIVMGDFNMIRSTADRNRLGGNLSNILHFNSIIQEHDLEEIPLKGRNYTWSNMQDNPLLEKLDWIFTSHNWTINFPNTLTTPMARLGSDHVPILIQVGTDIPRAQIFRFEEYWMDFDGFSEEVEKSMVQQWIISQCCTGYHSQIQKPEICSEKME